MDCAICLSRIDLHNEAYVYPCFHRYCFSCIKKWTEKQLQHPVDQAALAVLCPLCKAPYSQIIYDCVGSSYRSLATTGEAGSAPAVPHTAEQNRRRALYLTRLAQKNGGQQQRLTQAQKQRRARPRAATNQETITFIRRDIQAILLEEDVDLIVQHVLGVLKGLAARQAKNRSKEPDASTVYGPYPSFQEVVSNAVGSFLPEQLLAHVFAEELWAFLHSGLTIAGYDRVSFGGNGSSSSSGQEDEGPLVPADDPTE